MTVSQRSDQAAYCSNFIHSRSLEGHGGYRNGGALSAIGSDLTFGWDGRVY